jgi:hypothetical protein
MSVAAIIEHQLKYKRGNAKGVRNCFGLLGVTLEIMQKLSITGICASI